MNHGICHLSCAPVRIEPSDRSEMINQLLFGETIRVDQTKGNWCKITSDLDQYEGWIDRKQFLPLDFHIYQILSKAKVGYAIDLVNAATANNQHLPVVLGSTLPFFDGMSFKLIQKKYVYNGQAIVEGLTEVSDEMLLKCARKYLHAPYLWGGRSPFGIDCSGFTQVIFKLASIFLKRDAYLQAEQGSLVNLIQEAQPCDLAFFHNLEGKIIHVGIILEKEVDSIKIIHAHGHVRIDTLDQIGIYNKEQKKYTHQLKVIKRMR